LGYAKTIQEVAAATRNAKGPDLFSVQWLEDVKSITPNVHKLEEPAHTLMAYKDWLGRVRYVDYDGGPVGRPVASIAEFAGRGAGWWNIASFRIFSKPARGFGQMTALEGAGLTVVETGDGFAHLAVPAAIAAAWRGQEKTHESMMDSIQDFAAKRGASMPVVNPPPPAPVNAAPQGSRPCAPRPDWVIGVQYRLNHCGYPCGQVDGIMEPKTRLAMRAFQRNYCTLIDGVPGAEAQTRLVGICGY
jgi:Putative peptidoglycan binding domain